MHDITQSTSGIINRAPVLVNICGRRPYLYLRLSTRYLHVKTLNSEISEVIC